MSQEVEETQVSIDRRMNTYNVVYTHTHTHTLTLTRKMEYYSVLKRKEILSHATTWMNLDDIMLSWIRQSQKDKYCMIPLVWGI